MSKRVTSSKNQVRCLKESLSRKGRLLKLPGAGIQLIMFLSLQISSRHKEEKIINLWKSYESLGKILPWKILRNRFNQALKSKDSQRILQM